MGDNEMGNSWHYWLVEGEEGRLPLPVEDVDPKVFTSLEEARQAAKSVGRAVDIFRTPEGGGISEFVETVAPEQVVRPEAIGSREHFETRWIDPSIQDDREEITVVSKTLELRWNVEARPRTHIRQLLFDPPVNLANRGGWRRVTRMGLSWGVTSGI
jgi:hypothetical protein